MKKRDMKTWTAALRSGEYSQTKGALHDKDGFCCLGVAADVLIDGDWIYDSEYERYEIDHGSETLTSDVLLEIGLSDNIANQLAGLNDDGISFEKIADIIESNLDYLNDQEHEL